MDVRNKQETQPLLLGLVDRRKRKPDKDKLKIGFVIKSESAAQDAQQLVDLAKAGQERTGKLTAKVTVEDVFALDK